MASAAHFRKLSWQPLRLPAAADKLVLCSRSPLVWRGREVLPFRSAALGSGLYAALGLLGASLPAEIYSKGHRCFCAAG